jgi:hypothetical protein
MLLIIRRFYKITPYLMTGIMLAWSMPAAAQMGPAKWGNPNQSWGTRRPVTDKDRALIANYRSGHKQPVIETSFTSPDELHSQWDLQTDDRSFLKSCRLPENIVTTNTGLQLQTLAATKCHAKWSTGSMISKTKQQYGFFEATIKAADISGINNAFWLVTEDKYEIDIAEVHYPNVLRMTLHNNNNWDTEKNDVNHAVGFESKFNGNFSQAYHDYGVLWTPTDIIYEVDGQPVAAITTNGAITKPADIRFSTAVMEYAGNIPDNPAGHHMYVKSLRVYPL